MLSSKKGQQIAWACLPEALGLEDINKLLLGGKYML